MRNGESPNPRASLDAAMSISLQFEGHRRRASEPGRSATLFHEDTSKDLE